MERTYFTSVYPFVLIAQCVSLCVSGTYFEIDNKVDFDLTRITMHAHFYGLPRGQPAIFFFLNNAPPSSVIVLRDRGQSHT